MPQAVYMIDGVHLNCLGKKYHSRRSKKDNKRAARSTRVFGLIVLVSVNNDASLGEVVKRTWWGKPEVFARELGRDSIAG